MPLRWLTPASPNSFPSPYGGGWGGSIELTKRLACPDADQEREGQRDAARHRQARLQPGGRGDESADQWPEAKAERDRTRADSEDGRLDDARCLETDHGPEGRDQGAGDKATVKVSCHQQSSRPGDRCS